MVDILLSYIRILEKLTIRDLYKCVCMYTIQVCYCCNQWMNILL